jgi:trehalose 6-phosphate phosphatase
MTNIRLPDPAATAIFLDLDGTLIDIASEPHLVTIPPDLVPLLSRLSARLDGALAIVSGRTIKEIDHFLYPLRPVVAGVHGAEMRTEVDGDVLLTVGPLDPAVEAAVSRLSALAPGVLIEHKVHTIAVHFRLAPEAEPGIEAELKRSLQAVPITSSLLPVAVSSKWSRGTCPRVRHSKPSWACKPSRGGFP